MFLTIVILSEDLTPLPMNEQHQPAYFQFLYVFLESLQLAALQPAKYERNTSIQSL
ncbi:MAG: hypothetical protein CLLPBCKN_007169 [Chroococcidiopsis cubana SAG 39.79]|nr:hypothetical protein [Chroococcidiopsis cubana SAG 39.79]